MSFGGSPSDIVNIAKLCYKIYNFCRAAPAELQGLSNRLDKIGRKLDRLRTVLDESGVGTCEQVSELKQHLLDARAHLEPLLSATNGATSASGLARLALNQGKLRCIEKDLDADQRIIDEIKMDLIIECSLRTLRYNNDLQSCLLGLRPPSRLKHAKLPRIDEVQPVPVVTSTVPLSSEAVGSRITSTSTIVSNASEALMMVRRLRSRPITISGVPSEGSLRDVQITNDIISEIVSLAEKTELYLKDADPIQNLEHLREIIEKATQLQLVFHSSSADLRTGTAQHQLPTSDGVSSDLLSQELNGHLSLMTDKTSMRILSRLPGFPHTSATEFVTTRNSHSDGIPSNEVLSPSHSRDSDYIFRMSVASIADPVVRSDSEPSTQNQVNLRGWSKASLALDPKASLSCSFILEVSEGSVLLKIIPLERPHGTTDAIIPITALLSPSNSYRRSQSMSHATPTILSRSFHHCFQPCNRPIPHFLHPDVEGPNEEPDAPHTITFTERQYISVEGASRGPRWTTSLMYIFQQKQDQITLGEMIFGKRLLMSAGSDRISYDGREISHMSAVALWIDDASGTQSMTFFPNLVGKRVTSKDVELKLHSLWAPNKVPRNPNVLAVTAELMPRDDEGLDLSAKPERQSSVHSAFLSRASSATSQKWERPGKLKCTIQFTRSSDRASFLNHLK